MMIRKDLVAGTTATAVALSLSALARDDETAEDFSRYGEGSSVAGGESRKEFHTERMSEEELRELAATDETWGGYVESQKGSVEQEGRR